MHTPQPPRFDHQYGPHYGQMSMRDYFAGQALVGIIAAGPVFTHDDDGGDDSLTYVPKIPPDKAAAEAYRYADDMMAEREKEPAKQ